MFRANRVPGLTELPSVARLLGTATIKNIHVFYYVPPIQILLVFEPKRHLKFSVAVKLTRCPANTHVINRLKFLSGALPASQELPSSQPCQLRPSREARHRAAPPAGHLSVPRTTSPQGPRPAAPRARGPAPRPAAPRSPSLLAELRRRERGETG